MDSSKKSCPYIKKPRTTRKEIVICLKHIAVFQGIGSDNCFFGTEPSKAFLLNLQMQMKKLTHTKKVKKSKKNLKSFIVLLVSLFRYKISAWVYFYYLKNLCKICKINLYLLN